MNTNTNIFANTGNKPAGNFFNNNPASNPPNNTMFGNAPQQGANNLFGNNAANQNAGMQPAANTNIFTNNANSNNNPPTPAFGGATNPPATGNPLFGGQAKPAGNNPTIPVVVNNAQGGAQSNQPVANMFGNNQATGGNTMFGNNNPPANTAPTTNPPATGIFNGGNAATQPAATNIFSQNTTPNTAANTAPTTTAPTGGANLFGNNTPAVGNPLGTNNTGAPAANIFGNKGPTTNAAGTGNMFGGQNTTNAPSTPPATNTGNATNPQGTMFNNANNTAPANTAQGNTLFGAKPNPPAGQTSNQPNNPPAGNLFPNNPPAQGTQGTQGATNPTANLFGNTQANQSTPASNPGQNNPVGGNPNPGGMFNNPVNPGPPKDDLESEFQKSNQTIGELIQEYKLSFTNSYEDLKKLAESTLSFLDQREENQRIADNFTEVEKMISSNNDQVMRTLDSLEKQQEDIAHQLEVMSRKIGEGQYTHELSEHLQEYGELRKLVVELQEGEGEWNDPSQEQLINIFENLNQVEVQIREMNELVDIYLRDY